MASEVFSDLYICDLQMNFTVQLAYKLELPVFYK